MHESTNPHDALFKAAFSDPKAAESQLRALLPEVLLREIDFGALRKRPGSYVDEDLRQSHSDLLFSVPLLHRKEALLYLLQELLDLPEAALPAVGRHFPDFEFVLDDLSERSDQDLKDRAAPPLATLALALFKHGRQEEDLLAVWRSSADAVQGLKAQPDWTLGLQLAARYTYSVGDVAREDLARLVGEIAGAEAEEAVMTTAEQLKHEGKEEEKVQSRREILLRLLRVKLRRDKIASDIEQKIATADLASLDLWLERVVNASSLKDVFGE